MKTRLVAVMLCAAFAASPALAAKKVELKTQKDKVSYSLGYDMGNTFKQNDVDVDLDIMLRGMKDAMTGGKALLTEQEVRDTLTSLRQELMAKQQEKRKELTEKNKKEGEAFLAENKKKEGVKTLPSGLQYMMLEEGKGKSPKATDKVTVHYRGTLIDGTEFDSSHKRGQPATFVLNQVIRGWTEGVQLMKEGGKMQLFIPSELAYGERGAGQMIGPNAALIFEIELISVQEPEAPAAPEKKPEAAPAPEKKP